MKRGTLFWFAVMLASGFGLFIVKLHVQGLENRLGHANEQILHEEENIHALKAGWSSLNELDRIESLARRYLQMVPLTGRQYVSIDDIPWRAESAPNAAAASAEQSSTPLASSASAAAPLPARYSLPPYPPDKVTLARDAR
jgi:hypothetical protein